MSAPMLRAFPGFPPRRGDLLPLPAAHRPFPFDGRAPTLRFRFARAAVRAGLQLLGVQPGDGVLLPAYHHGIEVETVRSLGAEVCFYPLEPDLTVRVEALEALVTRRTRVLYAIHYFGFPQPLQALRRFCDERGLLLFEDCALALLSADGEVPLGSVGDAAAFCLYKTLPVPDGGLLVVNRGAAQDAERLHPERSPPQQLAADQALRLDAVGLARDSITWTRSLLGAGPRTAAHAAPPRAPTRAPTAAERCRAGHPFFDPAQLDLAMSPLTRLLQGTLDLAEVRQRRRRNYLFWREALADHLPCVQPSLAPGVCPLLFPVLVEDKAHLHEALLAQGLEVHNWWHRWFGGSAPGEQPQNDRLRRQLLGLPVQQHLSLAQLDRIRLALKALLPGSVR